MTSHNMLSRPSISRGNTLANPIRDEATFFDLGSIGSNLNVRVFVSSSPKQSLIEQFVEFMIEEGIRDIFNFCHPTIEDTPYDCVILEDKGIQIHNFDMEDGMAPSPEVLEEFDSVIDTIFRRATTMEPNSSGTSDIALLFHCQAGLGRAPTMLAYLMMRRFGWKSRRFQLMTDIREKRRNSFNHAQLIWIQQVKIKKISHSNKKGCESCILL